MNPLAIAAISGVPQIAGGIAGYFSHRKYAKLIEKQNLTMPSGIKDAETMYRRNARTGLPGKDLMERSVQGMVPQALTNAKRISSSPSELMGALSASMSAANGGMVDLQLADAQNRQQTLGALAQFLSTTKAGAENRIEDFRINRDLSAQRERMAGLSELFGGISGGAASGVQGFMAGKTYDLQKQMLATGQNPWNNSGQPQWWTPQPGPAYQYDQPLPDNPYNEQPGGGSWG